jgi:hypothetical protein
VREKRERERERENNIKSNRFENSRRLLINNRTTNTYSTTITPDPNFTYFNLNHVK